MKWVSYTRAGDVGTERVGVLDGETIFGLGDGVRLLDLLIDDGGALRDAAATARSNPDETATLDEVRLHPPLRPPLVRDFSTFEQHMQIGMRAIGRTLSDTWNDRPHFYYSNPHCVIGPNDDIVAPGEVEQLDFELGIAAVIGRGGRDLSVHEAESCVVGFTIFNDCSARDVQRSERNPHHSKDFASVVGPWFVTKDELEEYRRDDRYDLTMTASVNGRPYSRDSLANMSWSFAEMASYASRGTPLVPGDMLVSGTCATGCILELSFTHGPDAYPWLRDGDQLVLTADGLGQQSNRVAFGPASLPLR